MLLIYKFYYDTLSTLQIFANCDHTITQNRPYIICCWSMFPRIFCGRYFRQSKHHTAITHQSLPIAWPLPVVVAFRAETPSRLICSFQSHIWRLSVSIVIYTIMYVSLCVFCACVCVHREIADSACLKVACCFLCDASFTSYFHLQLIRATVHSTFIFWLT